MRTLTHPDISNLLGIVSYKIYPAQNGGQQSIATFYAELHKRNSLTLLVSRDNEVNPETAIATFPVLYSGYQSFLNLLLLYKIRRLIKQRNISCILVDHSYYAWFAWLLSRMSGIPFMIRSHNIETHRFHDLGRWYSNLYEKYESRIHRRAQYNWWISRNDLKYATKKWNINPEKSSVTTYGTLLRNEPEKLERTQQRDRLVSLLQISNTDTLFYFNGSLNYAPNIAAIRTIVYDIVPRLTLANIPFQIIITGFGLSEEWQKVLTTISRIHYLGFQENIDLYWEGTDCFINPVTLGSGIKTKIIESLAHGLPVVSTRSGMVGLERPTLQKVLVGVQDYDWEDFTKQMIAVTQSKVKWRIPLEFYQEFSLPNIVQNALLSLQTHANR
ncbi:MAG: glycosyltransferase family 4 protein [Sediminibacterium sp.]|nr:glycosyltransferase family 4 protein [Sediminibacterium sp.]